MVLKYRKHSTRDKGFVEHNGHREYFKGKFNSPESLKAYDRYVNKKPTPITPDEVPDGVTVADMTLRFDLWAEKHFGLVRTRYGMYKAAGKKLEPYMKLQAKDFGPLTLMEIRDQMEAGGKHVRAYINYTTNCIRYIFKWGVSHQLVPSETYTALMTVAGLEVGHSSAPESQEKSTVKAAWVKAVLPNVSLNVRRMIKLQWLTGCRSGSLCRAMPEQIKQGKKLWSWTPRHKTERTGAKVVISLGPRAQKLMARLLAECPAGEFLFSPRRVRNNKRYKNHYMSSGYRHAVAKAIKKANKTRDEKDKIPHWSPHQLRHTVGQRVRNRFGLEAAQATLAHESINATQIYARRRLRLARKVAAAIG